MFQFFALILNKLFHTCFFSLFYPCLRFLLRSLMWRSVLRRRHGCLTCALRLSHCILATRIWAWPWAPSYALSATHQRVWSVPRPSVSLWSLLSPSVCMTCPGAPHVKGPFQMSHRRDCMTSQLLDLKNIFYVKQVQALRTLVWIINMLQWDVSQLNLTLKLCESKM